MKPPPKPPPRSNVIERLVVESDSIFPDAEEATGQSAAKVRLLTGIAANLDALSDQESLDLVEICGAYGDADAEGRALLLGLARRLGR